VILLAQAWKHRTKILLIVAVGLLAVCKRQNEKIGHLKALLEQEPIVLDRVVTKTVEGPVRIVEKIIEKPGGEKIVERVITREVVVKEAASEHSEAPACPAVKAAPRWIVGASVDPIGAQGWRNTALIRGGVTLGGRLDLTVGHSVTGPNRSEVGVGVRF
jgi:hypothetical protein